MVTWLAPAGIVPVRLPPRVPVPVFRLRRTEVAVFTFRLIPPRSRAWTTTGKAATAVGSPPPFTEATASTARADHGVETLVMPLDVIEAAAGEPWHPFVLRTLELGLSGLENLSLIPGTVGAAPIQNVGAYGVEIKDVFIGLTAFDRETDELVEFDLQGCEFGYRDSLFKRRSGRYIILRVRFRLQRNAELNLDYGPVRQWLQQHEVQSPTASDVSRAICSIRREKLPDPAVLGNAGSFFKNPVVTGDVADNLRGRFPGLISFAQTNGDTKLAAGWLIERAGWKGYREGDAGVHRLQALVLVNYGNATGSEIVSLAQRIQTDVHERFGISLEIEPNVI